MLFDLIMRLYPASFRTEFEEEMRCVFLAIARERTPSREYWDLLRGAFVEWSRQPTPRAAAAIAGGTVFAFGTQYVLYRALLRHVFLLLCVFVGIAAAQQQIPKQDPAALETAK